MKNIIIITSVIFFSCATHAGDKITASPETMILWAHSDIQPRTIEERSQYESALEDAAQNFENIDIAIVAGDIANNKTRSLEDYAWYNTAIKRAPVKNWFTIAGNHDSWKPHNYRAAISPILHYYFYAGNILIIMMSDESKYAHTTISDPAFNEWKQLVMMNQDKIIITVTHACLEQSKLYSANFPKMIIKDSMRFAEVLKNYPVDIWISGHSHVSQKVVSKWSKNKLFPKTLFLEVSAIRQDALSSTESFFLFFSNGKDTVNIIARNHTNREFRRWMRLKHILRKKFEWGGIISPIVPFKSQGADRYPRLETEKKFSTRAYSTNNKIDFKYSPSG